MKTLKLNSLTGFIAWAMFILFLGIGTLITLWSYYNIITTMESQAVVVIIILLILLIGLALSWLWIGIMMLIFDYMNIKQPISRKSLQYIGRRKGKFLLRVWFFFLPLWTTKREIEFIEGEWVGRLSKNYLGKFLSIEENRASLADT